MLDDSCLSEMSDATLNELCRAPDDEETVSLTGKASVDEEITSLLGKQEMPFLEVNENKVVEGLPLPSTETKLIDDVLKNNLIEMQADWIRFHDKTKKEILADATHKLLEKFNEEREMFRMQLLEEMKTKMEKERAEYDYQLNKTLQTDIAKFEENHRSNIATTKKQQWCKVCFKEAIYACCWNTSYCSVECQGRHWPTHLTTCRRPRE